MKITSCKLPTIRKISFTVCIFISAWGTAQACCYEPPPSFFNPSEEVTGWGGSPSAHINTIYELQLLGDYFYPDWKGKKPRGNAIKSAEAHRLDFAQEAKHEWLNAEAEETAWARYMEFSTGLLERLEAGEQVQLPHDTGAFTEFYLYTLGFNQFRAHPENPEPKAWWQLLALPPEARRYRTVWAYYGLTLSAKTFKDTDFYLAKFRQALDAGFGFVDTAALEESMLRHLVRREPITGLRYLPLLLTAYQGDLGDKGDFLNDFFGWGGHTWKWKAHAPEFYQCMMKDRVGREIVLAINPEEVQQFIDSATGKLKESEGTFLCADRMAWHAFERGDFELGRTLLAVAPTDSLIGLFWEARFARGEGKYAQSATLLKRWVEVYQRRGDTSKVFKSFSFNPGDMDFPRLVNGELGIVLIKKSDMVEALYALDRAGGDDVALVAERLVTLDDLAHYAVMRPKDDRTAWFNAMVARRMIREGRVDDAGIWFESGKPWFESRWEEGRYWPWKEYLHYAELKHIADDTTKSNDERALAYYNIARLISGHGHFLMTGTTQPFLYGMWTLGVEWHLSSLDHFYERFGNDAIRQEIFGENDKTRLHFRYLGMDYASKAADVAENRDLKVAALVLGGSIPGGHDPQGSDVFFKRMCKLRPHPVAEIVNARNWFPGWMQRAVLGAPYQTLEEVVALVHTLETGNKDSLR